MKDLSLFKIHNEHQRLMTIVSEILISFDEKKSQGLYSELKIAVIDELEKEEKIHYLEAGEIHHQVREGLQRLNLMVLGQRRWKEECQKFRSALNIFFTNEEKIMADELTKSRNPLEI